MNSLTISELGLYPCFEASEKFLSLEFATHDQPGPQMVELLGLLPACVVRAGSVLAIGTLAITSAAMAQAPKQLAITQLRAALLQRPLWGRDYTTLVASISGWAQIQEKTIIVAPDVVFGGTSFRGREEAEAQARKLAGSLERPRTLAPDFMDAAAEGRTDLGGKITARPYSRGASYRVTVGFGSNFLPADLRIAEVQRKLGKEEAVTTEIEDIGEGRPIVYTNYIYADGALIFKLSNYAPAADQVFRVMLDIPSSVEAMGGTR